MEEEQFGDEEDAVPWPLGPLAAVEVRHVESIVGSRIIRLLHRPPTTFGIRLLLDGGGSSPRREEISIGAFTSDDVRVENDAELLKRVDQLLSEYDAPLVIFDAPDQLDPLLRRARGLRTGTLLAELPIIDPATCAAVVDVAPYPPMTESSVAAATGLSEGAFGDRLDRDIATARRLGQNFPILGLQSPDSLAEHQASWAAHRRPPVLWPYRGARPKPSSSWWGSLSCGGRAARLAAIALVVLTWPLVFVVVHYEAPSLRWLHVAIVLGLVILYSAVGPPIGYAVGDRSYNRSRFSDLDQWRYERGIYGRPSPRERLVEVPYYLLTFATYFGGFWLMLIGSMMLLVAGLLGAVGLIELYEALLGYP